MRALQGPARGAGRPRLGDRCHRDLAPPAARQGHRRPRALGHLGALLRARRIRGAARQRGDDGVLGRGDRLPDPRAPAPSRLWRVLGEVRQGNRRRAVPRRPDRGRGGARGRARADVRPFRRRDRLGPQRDLDRGRRARAPPRGLRRRAGPDRRHLRGGRAAGGRRRRRRLLLRPAEGLRLRGRALARADEPGGDRADRRARRSARKAGSPGSSRSPPRSTTRARTRPTTPPRWAP